MQRDGVVLNMVLRIFLRVIAQSLQTHAPGAANVDTAALHIGAVAFIHPIRATGVPFCRNNRHGATLRQRLHHRCGVPDVAAIWEVGRIM
jgi:hypothetical protein